MARAVSVAVSERQAKPWGLAGMADHLIIGLTKLLLCVLEGTRRKGSNLGSQIAELMALAWRSAAARRSPLSCDQI